MGLMTLMRISGIVYDSIVDGEGIRNTLFISGCKHYCKNCHNPQTWNFDYGKEFTIEKQIDFIDECKRNILLDGITISGGDPMYSADELVLFVKRFKNECPDLNIWIYSGFTYEEIINDEKMKELLSLCDVLVDGKYIEELKDTTLKFRGSSNQRVIFLKK